jgi:hypothetical protein
VHGQKERAPRRRTITLYADLFALKHQLEAEETAKPQEFVCGIIQDVEECWKVSTGVFAADLVYQ